MKTRHIEVGRAYCLTDLVTIGPRCCIVREIGIPWNHKDRDGVRIQADEWSPSYLVRASDIKCLWTDHIAKGQCSPVRACARVRRIAQAYATKVGS